MVRRFLCGTVLLLCSSLLLAAPPVRIAVIIDDIGYHRARGLEALNLPGEITAAVIPRSPHGPALARTATDMGREVIIHLPMAGNGLTLDPGGIRPDMAPEEIAAIVREAFKLVPTARGLNNHMGSVATRDDETMHWLMHELASHQAFFIDSRTTPDTVAESTARAHGLRTTGRDIFLDNERDLLAINEQFNALLRIARRRGSAIAIGHPYPETLEYLARVLPLLADAGVELVPVSALLPEAIMQASTRLAADLPDTGETAVTDEQEAEHEHQQTVHR
ncbi:divergent polysaccharide deacetylase family protein [Isoalcanivorax indicus]|uniref:divergent polysaccharide deacetylase family protein n=1 Tax=Isoalcanivorax indicus TaxID=2202653 RepID=UPI000DBA4657|nr:divergent polysaccharide deacetylase family protein [Isoalcanivorax indicus]